MSARAQVLAAACRPRGHRRSAMHPGHQASFGIICNDQMDCPCNCDACNGGARRQLCAHVKKGPFPLPLLLRKAELFALSVLRRRNGGRNPRANNGRDYCAPRRGSRRRGVTIVPRSVIGPSGGPACQFNRSPSPQWTRALGYHSRSQRTRGSAHGFIRAVHAYCG